MRVAGRRADGAARGALGGASYYDATSMMIIDVRTFVLVPYIGRDGLLPMQSVIPAA